MPRDCSSISESLCSACIGLRRGLASTTREATPRSKKSVHATKACSVRRSCATASTWIRISGQSSPRSMVNWARTPVLAAPHSGVLARAEGRAREGARAAQRRRLDRRNERGHSPDTEERRLALGAQDSYLVAIIVGGAMVALASTRELIAAPIGLPWFMLAGLIVLSGSATLRLPT